MKMKLTIDNLLHLLDSKSDFDEVICFARDLEVPELGRHAESPHEPGRVTLGFAMGNCMRILRVEEKLGIVIISSLPGNPPLDDWIRVSHPTYTFTSMLDRASRVLFDGLPGMTGMTGKVWLGHMGLAGPVAMLRKIDERFPRALVMELTAQNGRAEWIGFQGPFGAWVPRCLWADVQKVMSPEVSDSTVLYDGVASFDGKGNVTISVEEFNRLVAAKPSGAQTPFPGADAHQDKRGGELCVEGTRVPIARILVALVEESVLLDNEGDSRSKTVEDVAGDFDLDTIDVQECLRSLADWLKTQDWTGFKFAKPSGTETRRWVCSEEFAAFRAWQENRQVRRHVPDSDVVRDAKTKIRKALDADFIGELLSDARRIVESDYGTTAMSTAVAREVVRIGKNAFDLWWTWNKEIPQTPVPGEAEKCPKCGSANYGPDGAAMANACWDCGHIVEPEPECCDECGHPPAKGNVVYKDNGSRPLCPKCNPPKISMKGTETGRIPEGATGNAPKFESAPPFSGADVRCGKLCVEGAYVPVATVLLRLVDMEPLENGKTNLETLSETLGVDRYFVYRSLRGLAGWLESQNWSAETPAKCPKCGSENYGPDGAAMADTCWDCGFIRDEQPVAEKRCGTCLNQVWRNGMQVISGGALSLDPCPHHAGSHNPGGPPWDNCRFWKPRE